jgi:hypothetical protein
MQWQTSGCKEGYSMLGTSRICIDHAVVRRRGHEEVLHG